MKRCPLPRSPPISGPTAGANVAVTVNRAIPIAASMVEVSEDNVEGERNRYPTCEGLHEAREDHQIQRVPLASENREDHKEG